MEYLGREIEWWWTALGPWSAMALLGMIVLAALASLSSGGWYGTTSDDMSDSGDFWGNDG